MMKSVINDVPLNFKRLFKKEFNVKLIGEIEAGKNKKEMKKCTT